MRLICPNCDAQYEVDDGAIPEAGRDVQCSNCGHAWFQMPEVLRPAENADLYREPDPAPEPEVPAALQQGEPEPEAVNAPEMPDDDPAPVAEAVPDAEADGPPLPSRAIDESVLAVLREEAEREANARRADARRADAVGLELQGDLGLPPPVQAVAAAAPVLTEAERRIAALKGKPLPPPKAAARRDLLPDIEEINSTLRPSERAETMDEFSMSGTDDAPARTSGFRSGFFMVILIAVLMVALYLMAPRIAEQMPGTASTMAAYVAAVDAARAWLDGLIRGATSLLNGLTGGA